MIMMMRPRRLYMEQQQQQRYSSMKACYRMINLIVVVIVVIVVGGLQSCVTAETTIISTTTTTTTTTSKSLSSSSSSTPPPPYVNTICPKINIGNTIRWNNKYHNNNTCNRDQYDIHVQRSTMFRSQKYRHIKATSNSITNVPNEQSYICPINMIHTTTTSTKLKSVSGYDTTWIVENSASTPIVISWYNDEKNIEVSYYNNNIYPAIHDPNAILDIGQWRAIHTYEGHTFIVRSVLIDPITNTRSIMGPILYQHRAGLIPVGSSTSNHYICSDIDIEPKEPTNPNIVASQFSRTISPPVLDCNTISLGFRNMINCPVHAYFVKRGSSEVDNNHIDNYNNNNNNNTTDDQQLQQQQQPLSVCSEQFKFHLGVQNDNTIDFMYDWTSTTKYERSYVGHTFRFRLASNPDIIVDTITLQPTIIRDCPMSITSATTINTPTSSTSTSTIVMNDGITSTISSTSTSTKTNSRMYYTNSSESLMMASSTKQKQLPVVYNNSTTTTTNYNTIHQQHKKVQHQQYHQLPSTIVASQ